MKQQKMNTEPDRTIVDSWFYGLGAKTGMMIYSDGKQVKTIGFGGDGLSHIRLLSIANKIITDSFRTAQTPSGGSDGKQL